MPLIHEDDPIRLSAFFLLRLVQKLAENDAPVAERQLQQCVVELIKQRQTNIPLRLTYSPYSSLSDLLSGLSSTGSLAIEPDPRGERFFRLTLHGKTLLSNGHTPLHIEERLGLQH